jgi:SAM-dependent methyltransferase
MIHADQPHESFLASYEAGILNHADRLGPILRDLCSIKNPSTVLSIGIGAGFTECMLARDNDWLMSYVEPSALMRDAVRRTIDRFNIRSHIADEFPCTFEEMHTVKRYDLIIALDSWYRIGCRQTALQKALDLRSAGGTLIIQLLTRRHQLYWMLDQANDLIAAEELSRWATEQGFTHSCRESIHKVAVTDLIVRDTATHAYQHFVSFAKRRNWDDIGDDEKAQAIAAVRSLEHDGFISTNYGYLIFDAKS